jgi:hypothetical protein
MGLFSNIKAALFPAETGPVAPPPWVGRLQDAKYSAGGFEVDFLYLDLNSYFGVKTSAFGNVDANGVYMQHNGLGANRFPMLMVFSGGDNDQLAKTALAALTYRGDGKLQHPVFGPITVCPTGEIEQINAFVTASNQTSIAVELIETTGLLVGQEAPFNSVLDAYLENAAQSFADNVVLADKAEEVSLGQKILNGIGKIKEVNNRLSNGVAATQASIDDTFDSINGAIDTLVKDPIMLARQVQRLILTPGRELGLIRAKLDAYSNMAADIFGIDDSASVNTYDNTGRNNFAADSLMAGAMMAGLCQTGFNSTAPDSRQPTADGSSQIQIIDGNLFGGPPRKEIIKNAENIASSVNDYIEWADTQAATLGITDNMGDWQDLATLSGLTVSQIIEKAKQAQTETRFVTEYERSAQSWCFELYGSIKNNVLWFFQQTNDLSGDEILVIPENRELVKYV